MIKGFTLVELLVVITIIAILSVIGITAYTSFLKNARDSKRQSDLKLIQSALEDFHADKFSYPTSLSDLTPASGRVYMTQIPIDPRGASYSYVASPADCTGPGSTPCSGYCLSTLLEAVDLADECTPASGNNYGVTRP